MKQPLDKINRREAIQKASKIMGGALSTSLVMGVLAGCKADAVLDWRPEALTPKEVLIVAALAEQILPETSTPGARQAGVERFIDSMVAGYLPEAERNAFMDGLASLAERKFTGKTPEEQHVMVTELAEEARQQEQDADTKPFFLLAKEMTVLGFFTSEVGATQVLNYDPIPGDFQGCMPLDEAGGKTWAT
ncbi:MAG: gluconate 2-dehydrogenase subunit 3 family protein [Saprospiraceae bacterium]|nr:gluconate 2-dehydrogenase subunit 3 family protein [Saprospiraceae bacterium]